MMDVFPDVTGSAERPSWVNVYLRLSVFSVFCLFVCLLFVCLFFFTAD